MPSWAMPRPRAVVARLPPRRRRISSRNVLTAPPLQPHVLLFLGETTRNARYKNLPERRDVSSSSSPVFLFLSPNVLTTRITRMRLCRVPIRNGNTQTACQQVYGGGGKALRTVKKPCSQPWRRWRELTADMVAPYCRGGPSLQRALFPKGAVLLARTQMAAAYLRHVASSRIGANLSKGRASVHRTFLSTEPHAQRSRQQTESEHKVNLRDFVLQRTFASATQTLVICALKFVYLHVRDSQSRATEVNSSNCYLYRRCVVSSTRVLQCF